MPGGGINIDPIVVDTGNTSQLMESQIIKIGNNSGVELRKDAAAQILVQSQNLTDVRYNDNYAIVDGNVLKYFPSI